ncbi:conserved hypothetical protein, partial [Ricinus communis]
MSAPKRRAISRSKASSFLNHSLRGSGPPPNQKSMTACACAFMSVARVGQLEAVDAVEFGQLGRQHRHRRATALAERDGDEAPLLHAAVTADHHRAAGDFIAALRRHGPQRLLLRLVALLEAHGDGDGVARRQPGLEPRQENHRAGTQQGQAHGAGIEAHAHHHADHRRGPDRRRRGEATDVKAFAHDDAGAEEADAGDDALHDAGRIGADQVLRHVAAEPVRRITADHRQRGRCHAHQAVGAHAGRAAVIGALVSHQQAQYQRAQQIQENHRVGGQLGVRPVRGEKFDGGHGEPYFLVSCFSKAISSLLTRLGASGAIVLTKATKSSSSSGGHSGGLPAPSDRKKWPLPVTDIEYFSLPVRRFRRSTAVVALVARPLIRSP